jgi:multidrug resistance efflux pump
MTYIPDHPNDPNRPLEPGVPVNAEHASPLISLFVLIGIVVLIFGGWWLVYNRNSDTTNANQTSWSITTPSTTGAAPPR